MSASRSRQATELRRLMAAYRDAKDLIEIGAYVKGTNPTGRPGRPTEAAIDHFLRQDASTVAPHKPEPGGHGHVGGPMKRYSFGLDTVLGPHPREGIAHGDLQKARMAATAAELAANSGLAHYEEILKSSEDEFFVHAQRGEFGGACRHRAARSRWPTPTTSWPRPWKTTSLRLGT